MNPEQQNDAAMNRWTKKSLLPIIENDPLVALKFLQRYTTGITIGDPERFAFATMQSCSFAALDIARSLTENSSVPLYIRANAMALLVSHNLVYPQTTFALDGKVLRSLLQEEPIDATTWSEMVTLVRAISLSEELWQAVSGDIEVVLRKACYYLEIDCPLSIEEATIAVGTADRCRKSLREILSQPLD